MSWTEFVISTFLMIGVYAAFVGIFFFTYGSYTERKVIDNQMDILVKDFTSDFVFFANEISPESVKTLQNNVKTAKLPDSSEADKEVTESNNKLFHQAVSMLTVTLCVGVITSVCWWLCFGKSKGIKYSEVGLKVAFLLFLVMVVEFLFFTLISQNFRPVDPNKVKGYMLNSLEKYAGTA